MAMRQRNIVLLSDGTGNSSAKLNKTNIWRLYQALDLKDEKQIAIYDDGVGTSGFRPLMLLGGIFGWGLSRNVRDLYQQLCEHYRHVDEDEDVVDHIYIFGFSRGAFTARTLAGLIAKCGILDKTSENDIPVSKFRWNKREAALDTDEGLRAGVRLAYRTYRYVYSAFLTNIWRSIRRLVFRDVPMAEDFKSQYARPVKITFLGVFDTVAAIGLPIDELSLLGDRWIYPHRFSDQDLSQDVLRASHAIAVDDERHSFHPVLWNEKKESDPDRITQVWFPGMHSDVGGGYAHEGLAYVPLNWMIDQVKRNSITALGLDFQKEAVEQIESRTNASAKMHDSRAGLSVYYRYKPRDIDALCNCPDAKAPVEIEEPKIHASVFERVAAGTGGYAPTGVPTSYRLVDANGTITDGCELEGECEQRSTLLDRAKDHVFWRRIQYFLFAFTTLGFLAFPYFAPPVPNGGPKDDMATYLGSFFSAVEPFVPGFVTYWFDAWAESWPAFLALIALYLVLLSWAAWVKTNTIRLCELAWWHVRHPDRERPEARPSGRFEAIANNLRKSPLVRSSYRFISKGALPVATFIAALLVILGVAYRLFIHAPAAEARVCDPVSSGIDHAFGKPIAFATKEPCLSTGLTLSAGQTYAFDIDVDGAKPWKDASIPASPEGFDNWLMQFCPVFLGSLPAKRVLTYPWFTMVAEISGDPGEIYPLREPITIKPTTTGELRLYVNDAAYSFGERTEDGHPKDWQFFYDNNIGEAAITVSRR